MTNPFDFWMSTLRMPWSGDVGIAQDIDPRFFSPNLNIEFAGDRRIEGRIVSRVASYGQQLDTVIEALQTLAEATGQDLPDLDDLSRKIEEEKAASKADLAKGAREAMAALKTADPKLYAEVLAEQTGA